MDINMVVWVTSKDLIVFLKLAVIGLSELLELLLGQIVDLRAKLVLQELDLGLVYVRVVTLGDVRVMVLGGWLLASRLWWLAMLRLLGWLLRLIGDHHAETWIGTRHLSILLKELCIDHFWVAFSELMLDGRLVPVRVS